jgi:hypothetical protein
MEKILCGLHNWIIFFLLCMNKLININYTCIMLEFVSASNLKF